MRERFDTYLQERQAQQREAIRRQREQHEANIEQGLGWAPPANRFGPPPFRGMPVYGPRYPAAFPGYRTPYWQQEE
jgi:hypothetical protein